MNYRPKLIEVALPLDAINMASAKEKLIHVGTPSNLHAWWARRPLAACRAVIFASLVDDPGADLPPLEARERRRELFKLIERLVQWEGGNTSEVLGEASAMISAGCRGGLPVIVDPFCGSGSIPLEALRLGLDALANDLNPIAVAISKALVEVPSVASRSTETTSLSRSKGDGLDQFRSRVEVHTDKVLQYVRADIQELYKGSHDSGKEPIAWLWCRTVACVNPTCRKQAPLLSTFWLSKVPKNRVWLKFGGADSDGRPIFSATIGEIGEPAADGTINDGGASCVFCGTQISFAEIRAAGMAGKMGFLLHTLAVKAGTTIQFLPATSAQQHRALSAKPGWVPDSALPDAALGFRVQKYGLTNHRDLFLPRQLAVLSLFSGSVQRVAAEVRQEYADQDYANAIIAYLGVLFDRLVQTSNALVRWFSHPKRPSKAQPTFDKQTVQMVWDFAETNVLSSSTGGWTTCVKYPLTALDYLPRRPGVGRVVHGDARSLDVHRFFPNREVVFSTDPPYFDNIGYADLSDFFYVWLRRTLQPVYPELFQTMLVPKSDEIIADASRHANDRGAAREFFYSRMRDVFQRMHDSASDDYPSTIFYAFKQEEYSEGGTSSTGWEAMLQALLDTGWMITGTWPIRTEHANRPRGIGANALASSIVLSCRRRGAGSPSTTRGSFRQMLRVELPRALRVLQEGSIAPVDVPQASIGPGIAIFSRHAKVLEADGTAMTVGTSLKLINEALDEFLSATEGELDADSRFAVTWFETHGYEVGAFGEAENLAKARNVSVSGVAEAGILSAAAGKVRLLRRADMPAAWNPTTDKHLTVWEATQHLIKRLEERGEGPASDLLRQLGPVADQARVLAYRLYSACERRKWADEARAYNGLVVAWPELERLAVQSAGAAPAKPNTAQESLF